MYFSFIHPTTLSCPLSCICCIIFHVAFFALVFTPPSGYSPHLSLWIQIRDGKFRTDCCLFNSCLFPTIQGSLQVCADWISDFYQESSWLPYGHATYMWPAPPSPPRRPVYYSRFHSQSVYDLPVLTWANLVVGGLWLCWGLSPPPSRWGLNLGPWVYWASAYRWPTAVF